MENKKRDVQPRDKPDIYPAGPPGNRKREDRYCQKESQGTERKDQINKIMSQGFSCKCPEKNKPISKRNWFVLQRECNFSAFSGYHYTPSAYSGVRCMSCGTYWRTKANYVRELKDEV